MRRFISFVIVVSLLILIFPMSANSEAVLVNERFNVTDDAYVVNSSGMTTGNYGNEDTLYTKSSKTNNEARQIFLKYDCSRLVGATIKKAVMYIKSNPRNITVSGVSYPNGDTNIIVNSITNKSWTEGTVTWTNRPTSVASTVGTFYYGLPSGGDKWCSLDITNYLINEPDKIASFTLDTEVLSGQNRCYFYSKEKGDAYAPYLQIEYEPAPVVVPFQGTKTYDADADAYVVNSSGATDDNFGLEPLIYAKSTTSLNEERRGYLRFLCPDLIGQDIDSAVLYIKSKPQVINGDIQNDSNICFYGLSEKNWSETGITWDNQPTDVTGLVGKFFYQQVRDTWYAIDVTDYLNRQPDKCMSFLLKTESTANNNRCYFYSKDADDVANRPYLVIKNGFKNVSGFKYSFTDAQNNISQAPVTGGSVEFNVTVRSNEADINNAVILGALYDSENNQLLAVSENNFSLPLGTEKTLNCKINNIPNYDRDKTKLRTYLFKSLNSIDPLFEKDEYSDPNSLKILDGRINVISPYYRDTVNDDNVNIKLYAPSFDNVMFESVHQPDAQNPVPYSKVFANVIPGGDGLVETEFPASEFPYGPISVLITGYRNGGSVKQYLQLYNNAGVKYDIGMPDTPPAAQGMTLAFYDDFTNPALSISRTGTDSMGRRTTYSSHTPYNGDYGEARFEDYEGQNNPFEQKDSFLKIKARKASDAYYEKYGKRYYGGLLSTIHPDGSGKSWTMGYFECRMFMPPGYGPWGAFWLLSKNRLDTGPRMTSEVDIVEAYMFEPNKPRINYPRWSFTDGVPDSCKSIKDYDMTQNGMFDMAQWFHTYACKITNDYLYIYIDNNYVGKMVTDEETKGQMFLMMNLAIGKGGGGMVDLTEYGDGADLYIDYVRVYTP